MVSLIAKPEVFCIQNASIYSRWNSVHNQSFFKLKRVDAVVSATGSYSQNKLFLSVNDIYTYGYAVGDTIYVDGYNTSATIFAITTNFSNTGYTRIETNLDYAGLLCGYINNHTLFKGFYLECRVITKNYILNNTTTHEAFNVYPDTSGMIYIKPHGYCLRELKKINKSPYGIANTNWNDVYAWCEYYVQARVRYIGEVNIPDFSSVDYALQIYQSTQLVHNYNFANGLNEWSFNSSQYFTYNSLNSNVDVNGNNAYKVIWATLGYLGNPVMQGSTYNVEFSINITPNANAQVFVREYPSLNVIYTTGSSGVHTLSWTALTNASYLQIVWNPQAVGSLNYMSILSNNAVLQQVGAKYFATNSVRQIQSRLNENMCEHLCVYTTIPVDANRGKFISDFERPTKFKNYPFDITYIQHETMETAGGNVASKEELYNYNKVATGISTFSLQSYARGEHRLRIRSSYADSDTSIDVWIEAGGALDNGYVDEQYVTTGYVKGAPNNAVSPITSRLMQVMNVKLDNKCKENPIYLAWKGRRGGMNYWLFSKTQTIGTTIGEVQKFEPYYESLDIQGRTSVLTKSDKPTMVVGADNIDLNDIKGLMGLTASNFVQMYISAGGKSGPIWQTINVKEGSFKYYETGNGRHNIELTLEMVENYVHTL